MTSTTCRRVAKLEGALHPREAVLAWLVEVRAYEILGDRPRAVEIMERRLAGAGTDSDPEPAEDAAARRGRRDRQR